MAKVSRRSALTLAGGTLIIATVNQPPAEAVPTFRLKSRAATLAQFGSQRPSYWGMYAPGVRSRFSTATSLGRDAIALTFDACGGSVTRYDDRLIAALRTYQVPATLFINRTWATNNPGTFKSLLADPLFEIQNHGWLHQPLSVTGRSAYGIAGTRNLSAVWEEVASNNWYMGYYYNHQTTFMRVGTASPMTSRRGQLRGWVNRW